MANLPGSDATIDRNSALAAVRGAGRHSLQCVN